MKNYVKNVKKINNNNLIIDFRSMSRSPLGRGHQDKSRDSSFDNDRRKSRVYDDDLDTLKQRRKSKMADDDLDTLKQRRKSKMADDYDSDVMKNRRKSRVVKDDIDDLKQRRKSRFSDDDMDETNQFNRRKSRINAFDDDLDRFEKSRFKSDDNLSEKEYKPVRKSRTLDSFSDLKKNRKNDYDYGDDDDVTRGSSFGRKASKTPPIEDDDVFGARRKSRNFRTSYDDDVTPRRVSKAATDDVIFPKRTSRAATDDVIGRRASRAIAEEDDLFSRRLSRYNINVNNNTDLASLNLNNNANKRGGDGYHDDGRLRRSHSREIEDDFRRKYKNDSDTENNDFKNQRFSTRYDDVTTGSGRKTSVKPNVSDYNRRKSMRDIDERSLRSNNESRNKMAAFDSDDEKMAAKMSSRRKSRKNFADSDDETPRSLSGRRKSGRPSDSIRSRSSYNKTSDSEEELKKLKQAKKKNYLRKMEDNDSDKENKTKSKSSDPGVEDYWFVCNRWVKR